MRKLLLLLILLVLALGCAPEGPKVVKFEPETATYFRAEMGKCDGCDPNDVDYSKVIYTTEFEEGIERVFCFATVTVIKGTKLKFSWYYGGKLLYEVPATIERTLPPGVTLNVSIDKEGGLWSGDYEVVLSMNGEKVDKLSFVIGGKTAKPVEPGKPAEKDANQYFEIAVMALTLEDYDKAIFNSSKVIEMAPDSADGYNVRGLAYMLKGQHDQAISDFDKVIEIDPLNDQAYNNRGGAWSEKGNYDKACPDWKRACELGGDCGNYELAKTKWCK